VFKLWNDREIFILSIDGGGIRGLVPACFLAEMERILNAKKPDTYLYELFHFIAGTSTGGLIALGLTTPFCENEDQRKAIKKTGCRPTATAEELVEVYRTKGPLIFPPGRYELATKLKHAFKTKYDGRYLTHLLQTVFGNWTLEDLMTNVLITSYDTLNREPRFFKHRCDGEKDDNPNFFVRDVARATTAAPTFFSPALIKEVPDTGKTYSLIDGAVVSSNPAMTAYIETLKLYPRARRFVIISLGTGIVDKPYPYEEVKDWGYMDWMSAAKGLPLFDMIMDGQRDTVDHMLGHLPGVEYYRFDFSLDSAHTNMDDITPKNIDYLEGCAEEMVEQNRHLLLEICKRLC
jgi:patatin-like phospholipase/acyl hydrolase